MKTKWVIVIVVVCAILIVLSCYLYPFALEKYLHQKHADNLGQYGDIYGGLNTLFTGLAFVGLVATIILQRQEMSETRREFEEQTAIMSRQALDNAMFEYLKYMKSIYPFNIKPTQSFEGIDSMLHNFVEHQWCQHEQKRLYVNALRKALMEYSTWRRVMSSWFLRVDASGLQDDANGTLSTDYKVRFWDLLSKEDRCLAFLQCALVSGTHQHDWQEMQKLFANQHAIAAFFDSHNYTDTTYTLLINLLAATSAEDYKGIELSDYEVKRIIEDCEAKQLQQYKMPRVAS